MPHFSRKCKKNVSIQFAIFAYTIKNVSVASYNET